MVEGEVVMGEAEGRILEFRKSISDTIAELRKSQFFINGLSINFYES